jgi:hypothetical protein
MRLLDLLAEALSQEKENALRDKFVVGAEEKGFQPNKLTEKEFKAVLAIDESPNGKYLNWILPRYVKLDRTERARFFQDGHNDRVKELLVFFDNPSSKSKIKKAINNPKIKEKVTNIYLDINQYNSLRDFENILSALQSFLSDEVISPDDQKKNTSSGGEPGFVSSLQYPVKIGVTPSGFTVYKIPQLCKSNKECFREYRQLVGCRGESDSDNLDRPALDRSNRDKEAPTRGFQVHYCTRFPGQFDNYLSSGPYYIFINWGARRIYQLHYETGQLKDENDEEINGYNSKSQNEFLQFLLDTEGRIPTKSLSFNLDLKKFKQGDIDGFPIYKIGPMYYIDAKTGEEQQNKLVYFDSNTSQVKNADGTSASIKNSLRAPYDKLVRYLYENGLFTPEKGTPAYANWMMTRVFSNLDIPPTASPKIKNSVNLSGTNIKTLPANLTIDGDLDLSNSTLQKLPENLKVTGTLNIKGTGLKAPEGIAGKIIQD